MTRKRLLGFVTTLGALLLLFALIGGAAGQEGERPGAVGDPPDADGTGGEADEQGREPATGEDEPRAAPNVAAPEVEVGYPFAYQGQLVDGGSPAEGAYDFRFHLYDALSGGTLLGSVSQDITVGNGLFQTTLNFGDVFDGQARWLEIEVAPDGSGSYTTLSPRQELVAAPYAHSLRPGATIAGTLSGAALTVNNDHSFGDGIHVDSADYGIKITQSRDDGIWVDTPAQDGVWVGSSGGNGYTAWGPTGNGVFVTGAGTDGLDIVSPGGNGLDVSNPGADGVEITGAGGYGVYATNNNASNAAGFFYNGAAGGSGVFASGTTDLLLNGQGVIANSSSGSAIRVDSGGDFYVHTDSDGNGTFGEFIVYEGAGTANSDKMFEVQEDRRLYMFDRAGAQTYVVDADTSDGGAYMAIRGPSGDFTSGGILLEALESDTGGQIILFNDSGEATITLDAEQGNGNPGRITTDVLQINGGADLSEQFDVRASAGAEPEAGQVVCIDATIPGALVVCEGAYDKKVAGVISGAGGVQPGLLMGQAGSVADGEHPIALTGRVYVWADATNGAIDPGDLLTTGKLPGHAMKVADHDAAQGAILGKAMTALDEGQGLILVLVTLQ